MALTYTLQVQITYVARSQPNQKYSNPINSNIYRVSILRMFKVCRHLRTFMQVSFEFVLFSTGLNRYQSLSGLGLPLGYLLSP